uniref:C-type lectin domain-containing protein n=1 Tax=Astyanax mexicanus TaxID=7994 RepID=A0A3B1JTF5_ASTMX
MCKSIQPPFTCKYNCNLLGFVSTSFFLQKRAKCVHSFLSTDQTDLTFSYHLITENKTWYEAQSYCRKNYADLVSIRDQEQNEAVKIAGMKSSGFFWIGLLRDDWEWADGGRSAYRNWEDGQPRSLSNCTLLNYLHKADDTEHVRHICICTSLHFHTLSC